MVQISVAAPAINAWHCIETKIVNNAVNGEYRVYWDGVEAFTDTGLDTSGMNTGIQVIHANFEALGGTPVVYSDSWIASTTYIGPL